METSNHSYWHSHLVASWSRKGLKCLICASKMLNQMFGGAACSWGELCVNRVHINSKSKSKMSRLCVCVCVFLYLHLSEERDRERERERERETCCFACDLLDPHGKLYVLHPYPPFPWLLIHGCQILRVHRNGRSKWNPQKALREGEQSQILLTSNDSAYLHGYNTLEITQQETRQPSTQKNS